MKITVRIDGDLRQQMADLGLKMLDGSNRATERQTKETQQTMRSEITRGLTARAANALRSEWFYNPVNPGGTQLVGFLYSAWRRKPRSGGADIDMLAAYESGAIIRPVRGKYLVVALPAAYAVVGARDGGRGKRPTPLSVETALDQDLFYVQKPGHLPVLAAKNVSVAGGKREGAIAKIRAARFRNKRGGLSRRRTTGAIIPMFVLLRNVHLPKRVDFSRIESEGTAGLESKLLIELAGRGVLD